MKYHILHNLRHVNGPLKLETFGKIFDSGTKTSFIKIEPVTEALKQIYLR